MLLAIDVGNTRTKVYNRTRGGELTFETSSIVDLQSAAKVLGIGRHSGATIIGASVVPRVAQLIDEASRESHCSPPVWISGLTPLGFRIAYTTPETLGADRVANVLGALQIATPPLIVVDLGTATKIEAVDHEGTYLGGSIMPSAQMGLRSLQTDTAQLPEVTLGGHAALVGTDTESAIRSGVVLGHRFGIDGLVRHYYSLLAYDVMGIFDEPPREVRSKEPRAVSLIITGGNADLFPTPAYYGDSINILGRRESQLTAIGLSAAAKILGLSVEA